MATENGICASYHLLCSVTANFHLWSVKSILDKQNGTVRNDQVSPCSKDFFFFFKCTYFAPCPSQRKIYMAPFFLSLMTSCYLNRLHVVFIQIMFVDTTNTYIGSGLRNVQCGTCYVVRINY